ncbi:MAG TPA: hypothetical protein VII23_13485 [Terriglobales bacterium]
MKRCLPELSETAHDLDPATSDGIFLVRVDRARYCWHARKPSYELRLSVLEPLRLAGRSLVSRLDCTPKAMWKLGWFLRDFVYDPELLARSEIDEGALRGLTGIAKISHSLVNGMQRVNLEGFAPASQWKQRPTPTGFLPEGRKKPDAAAQRDTQ